MRQVIICGILGIPPSNGVLPQSPMHTKSLATLKHQVNTLVMLVLCTANDLFLIISSYVAVAP